MYPYAFIDTKSASPSPNNKPDIKNKFKYLPETNNTSTFKFLNISGIKPQITGEEIISPDVSIPVTRVTSWIKSGYSNRRVNTGVTTTIIFGPIGALGFLGKINHFSFFVFHFLLFLIITQHKSTQS